MKLGSLDRILEEEKSSFESMPLEESKIPDIQESADAREKNYIERSKTVGRIGPPLTQIDISSIHGDYKIHSNPLVSLEDQDNGIEGPCLSIEAVSSWVSARANTAVFDGCFYYQVMIHTDGIMQIGWAQLITIFSGGDGVGDDTHSYAYDGHRVKKWNGAQIDYGEAWSTGDIIGTLIDFKSKEVMFWRNGKFLGVAFNNVPTGENCAYFPAISLEKGQIATFNFGL